VETYLQPLLGHWFSCTWIFSFLVVICFFWTRRKKNPGVHEKDKSEKWGKGSFRIV
jgi:hypothetical protein